MEGGCLCEGVLVSMVEIRPKGIKCYCPNCRKVSGSAFATVVLTGPGGFTIERGQELLGCFESSPGTERRHCRVCFTHVYSAVRDRPDVPVFVSAALFDPAELAGIEFEHIFVKDVPAWHQLPEDGRQRFQEFPTDGR